MNIALIPLASFLFINGAFAQHNIIPDTLPRTGGVKYVVLTNKEGTPFYKFYFDEKGRNYKNEGLDSTGKASGRVLFSYSDAQLDTLTRFSTYRFEPVEWDSTSLSSKIVYEYQDNQLKRLSWLDDGDFLSMQIDYYYDRNNRLAKERVLEYSRPGVISLSAFEPNTTNFKDSITEMANSVREKVYNYDNGKCSISYYLNQKPTGSETQLFEENNNLLQRIIQNIDGEIILKEEFKYDSENQEIEKTIFQTGYDGYGYSYDFVCFDRYTKHYFEDGRIKSTINYCGDDYKSVVNYNWIK